MNRRSTGAAPAQLVNSSDEGIFSTRKSNGFDPAKSSERALAREYDDNQRHHKAINIQDGDKEGFNDRVCYDQ